MNGVYMALALAAGAMLPLQAVVNGRLARAVGGPVWAASISALVVAVVLATIALVVGKPIPRSSMLVGLPWWAWIGGLCGAVVLAATAACAPRIGASVMVAMIMAGQIVAALLLDRMGWFGMSVHTIDMRQIIAAGLLITGAVIMALPPR